MPKPLLIAVREYLALVRTKAFLISVLLVPAMMALSLMLIDRAEGVDQREPASATGGPHTVAVVDGTGAVAKHLDAILEPAGFRTSLEPAAGYDPSRRLALSQRVRDREIAAIVEVDPGALANPAEGPSVRIYTGSPTSATARWLLSSLRDALQLARFEREGIDPERARTLLSRVGVTVLDLPEKGAPAAERATLVRTLAPFMSIMLVFLAVVTTAPQLLQAVIEEKQQRIAEVLLGAASPYQIMMGKLLGTAGAGLTVLAAYLTGGALIAGRLDYGELVSAPIVGLMLVDVALALVMFGALFLALGAAANELKDAQGLMPPVMLVLVLPLLTLSSILSHPDGPLATGLSLFPLTAPMAMPVRMGAGAAIPGWQIALAVALVVLTTVAVVWAAGRVFRVGVLAQGQAPGARELLRWIARG